MKRYKVTKMVTETIETTSMGNIEHIIIPAGTEICLEEVKEKCSHDSVTSLNNKKFCCDCGEEVKEEKEHEHFWLTLSSAHKKGEHWITVSCLDCGLKKETKVEWDGFKDMEKRNKEIGDAIFKDKHKEEEQAIVSEQKDICGNAIVKDQPLTPKDVGMRKGEALEDFRDWLRVKKEDNFWSNHAQLYKISDEEFDRLYQQFLYEHKKDHRGVLDRLKTAANNANDEVEVLCSLKDKE